MLTSKVGETIINCFDGKYDKYTLKQWSNKGILKCPVCNGKYEYCHGEIILPYFRHEGKECDGYFSEPETDEHKQGKMLLYNWIKNKHDVENCKLEAWIPETKQRPDIYFEYRGDKYVIEFQCTPIASEFLKRKELYKLAGINDIWILGTEKYLIQIDKEGNPFHEKRFKSIEKILIDENLIYLNVKRKILITDSTILQLDQKLIHSIRNVHFDNKIKKFDLFDKYFNNNNFLFIESLFNFSFIDSKIQLNEELQNLLRSVREYYLKESDRVDKEKAILKEKIEKMKEKAKEMKEKVKNIEPNSRYVGNIGEIININLLLAEKIYFRSYDSFLYKFIDEDGNILTWLTSTSPNINIGDCVKLTGKIKSHSEYCNSKQTRLIRCDIDIVL